MKACIDYFFEAARLVSLVYFFGAAKNMRF